MQKQDKYIYIIISSTKTLLGKMIQTCLGVEYNHCSIALDNSLKTFYSFGRKDFRNALRGGFVIEGKEKEFFKCHSDSYIVVMKIPVSIEQFTQINSEITRFSSKECRYKYSILGLIYCFFGIPKKRKQKYFCSQFVAEIIQQSGMTLLNKPPALIKPHDFLGIKNGHLVYKGAIGNYKVT